MRPILSAVLALLLLALLVPTEAHAARKGKKSVRIEAVVNSPEGEALPGVSVRVTSPEAPGWSEQLVTDDKGRFVVTLERADRSYLWTLTAEGYDSLITTLEIDPRYDRTYELTMPSLDSPEALRRRAVELYNRGVEELQSGNAETALATFEEAAELNPELMEAQRAIAEAALAANRPERSAEAAEALLAADEDSLPALRLLLETALTLKDEERLSRAVEGLAAAVAEGSDEAVKIGSYSSVLVFNDGVLQQNAGEAAQAEARFVAATRLNPELAAAHAAVASYRLQREDAAGALESAQRALEIDPQNESALSLQISAASALGDEDALAAAVQDLEAQAPEAAQERKYQEAESLFKAGDYEAARAQLEEVVAARPEMAEAHYTLGRCYLNLGNNAKAKEHLARVQELAPESSWARDAEEMLGYLN
ncbi:MAG: tetratricopeptide repeat protein [Acidobacteriota bacterium]|nr:tetratricopeptide repeat protein [Acidobacteriota bacterium]